MSVADRLRSLYTQQREGTQPWPQIGEVWVVTASFKNGDAEYHAGDCVQIKDAPDPQIARFIKDHQFIYFEREKPIAGEPASKRTLNHYRFTGKPTSPRHEWEERKFRRLGMLPKQGDVWEVVTEFTSGGGYTFGEGTVVTVMEVETSTSDLGFFGVVATRVAPERHGEKRVGLHIRRYLEAPDEAVLRRIREGDGEGG